MSANDSSNSSLEVSALYITVGKGNSCENSGPYTEPCQSLDSRVQPA